MQAVARLASVRESCNVWAERNAPGAWRQAIPTGGPDLGIRVRGDLGHGEEVGERIAD
jgi:hypothetical protein